jgi:geranylgeranyl reductase family protein
MKPDRYDCIIVGAGPAGGAAAYHLANRGVRVLLVEKAELPRYKPCGGLVSPAVAGWFDWDFTPVIERRLTGIRYTWRYGEPIDARLRPDHALWMVRRESFDAYLVQKAQARGAVVRDATPVEGIGWVGDDWQVRTRTDTVRGRYAIAADGAKGPTARWLGWHGRVRHLAAGLEVETDRGLTEPERIHLDFGSVRNGYLWNFPKLDGCSLGAGAFGKGHRPNLRRVATDYGKAFGIEIGQFPQYGHPIPLWNGHRVLHSDHAVLAGDAAGLVDPLTAEGIRPALLTGCWAAEAVAAALAGEAQALAGYTRRVHREWGEEMRWAKRLSDGFYRFPELAYRGAVRRPGATEVMGQLLSGERRYRDVAERALTKLVGEWSRR